MSLMSINYHFFFSQCSVSQRNGRNTCQDLQQIESFENSVSVDFYIGKKPTFIYVFAIKISLTCVLILLQALKFF